VGGGGVVFPGVSREGLTEGGSGVVGSGFGSGWGG